MFEFPDPELEAFYRTYQIQLFAVNKDETQIAMATNLGGKFNLWGINLPGGYPYPMTVRDQTPRSVRFDPQGRYVLVGFDNDGDEFVQIYAVSPQGGPLIPVRTAVGKRHFIGGLSEDGNRLYYTSDKDNPMFMNLYRYDLETKQETLLLEGQGATTFLSSLAPDESSFVYVLQHSNTHAVPYAMFEGKPRPLTPDENTPQVVYSVDYLDEDTVILTTTFGQPFTYLAKYTFSSGRFEPLLSLPQRDIESMEIHRASKTAYCVAQRGVEDELYAVSLETGTEKRIPFPGALIQGMSCGDSGRLYVLTTSETRPPNLYRREMDGTFIPLTDHRVFGIPEERLTSAQTVRYPSFDGLEIEALLYRSPAERSNGHTIIMPHGGPQSADRRSFWSLTQFLIWRGYDVFAPNFRGSSGYGAEFMKRVDRDWGGGPRKDMVAGIEWLLATGQAKPDRLFVLGGSYGGYMTLLLHGRHADYFRAAVDIFGVANLFTFYHSVPDFWKPAMDTWVGNPERDKEKMTEDSPITYLDGMIRPMLVVQGANDPRVVKAESDQIVEALRAKGRDVEYLVLDDEGHGFTKKENELRVYRAVADFLDRHRAS